MDLSDVASVASRGLGEGAANLESRAAVDEYAFTVPAGGARVVMDWTKRVANSSSGHAKLELVGPGGQVVWSVADVGSSYPRFEEQLVAGDYVFRVSGLATSTSGTLSGSYDFQLFAVSEALSQVFEVDLSTPQVERVLVNSSTPGAGLLETSASVDQYRFTVPADSSVIWTFSMPLSTSGTGPLLWTLVDSAGQVVNGGELKTSTSMVLSGLSGAYTLSVSRNPDLTGTTWWNYAQTLKFTRAAA